MKRAPPLGPSVHWLRVAGRSAVVLAILLFVAWCVRRLGTDLARVEPATLLRHWPSIAAAALLSLLNYVLRAARWQAYLRRLGHVLPWRFNLKSYVAGFAFTLSPGKIGEMARARYYAPAGIPVRRVAACMFVERLTDMVAMLLLATASLAADRDMRLALAAVGVGLATLIALLCLLPWSRLSSRYPSSGATSAALRAAAKLFETLAEARALLAPSMLAMSLALALVAWFAEAWGLMLISEHVAPMTATLPDYLSIYATAVIVGAVSFMPGGLGGTEAVMAALLYRHGHTAANALMLTMVCRLLTLWLAVALGWVAVAALRRSKTEHLS